MKSVCVGLHGRAFFFSFGGGEMKREPDVEDLDSGRL